MPPVENVGYILIRKKRIAGVEIVLGKNPSAVRPYVTWIATEAKSFTKFFAGHYFSTERAAVADFNRRVKLERLISGC